MIALKLENFLLDRDTGVKKQIDDTDFDGDAEELVSWRVGLVLTSFLVKFAHGAFRYLRHDKTLYECLVSTFPDLSRPAC